jgi:transcriptional regulator of NAD metabolism
MGFKENDKIRTSILNRLYRHGYIGGRHTSIKNVQKGLPKHCRGEAEEIIKELSRKGILLMKKTKDGDHISLNPKEIRFVEDVIDALNKKDKID